MNTGPYIRIPFFLSYIKNGRFLSVSCHPPSPHRSQTPESYPKKKSFVDQRKAGWALENPTVYYSYIPRPQPNIYSYSPCLTFAVLVVMHMQVLVKQLFLV